jgi:aminoglycoside phosphotransferase (APT) family kinase protein
VSENNDIARATKLGKDRTLTTSLDDWKSRLETFLNKQPDVRGLATVDDLRLPTDGGASSGTVLFTAHYGDGSSEKLVLRYSPKVSHTHEYNLVGQYHILKALQETNVPAPRVLGLDEHGEHFGAPSFLMYCIDGAVLPPTYPIEGPLFDADPATRLRMIEEELGALAKIHRVDWQKLDIEKHTRKGKGKTLLERDMDWYLTALKWGGPDKVAAAQPVLDWLLDHQFEPSLVSFCHGDSSLHNYMYKNGHLVAVLDWEFAFIGTPEIDLGFQVMANEMLGFGHAPLEGMPNTEERNRIYERIAGRKLDHWDYYLTAASYKMYTHMALSFREPELASMGEKYISYAFARLLENWEAAKR